MFSLYMWNEALSCGFAEQARNIFPDLPIIFGGPNYSLDNEKNYKFLEDYPAIDAIVIGEGEVPAAHLIKKLMQPDGLEAVHNIHFPNIIGRNASANRKHEEEFEEKHEPWLGMDNQEIFGDIKSPYTSGLFDKFFIDGLRPLIETNRGCPFKCSFCQQGQPYFNRVRHYSTKYIRNMVKYIGKKIHDEKIEMYSLEIADANLGMFKRDAEIMEIIRDAQDKYDYPQKIGCSTGKNRLEMIMENIGRVQDGSIQLRSAMQSLNEPSLKAVQRDNIKLETYYGIQKRMDDIGVDNVADIMLGLPEETVETHSKGIYDLLDMGVKEFACLQTIILKSTEFEKESYRKKYGITTRLRPIPECNATYNILGKTIKINEMEEVVYETSAMDRKGYLQSRKLHLVIMIFHNTRLLMPVYKYLKYKDIKASEIIRNIMNLRHEGFDNLVDEFLADTESEQFPVGATMPKDADIDILTANKIFRYLAVALFTRIDVISDVLHLALSKILSEENQDITNELTSIFTKMVITPSVTHESSRHDISSPELKDIFGNKIELSISERQVNLLNLFNNMYQAEEDKINKMVYHLRPQNLSMKINSIMA